MIDKDKIQISDIPQSPRIAIVCDWLTGIGGAEKVVLEIHKMYPDAPIYTSQYDPIELGWFSGADVRTGWLQKFPTSLKKFMPVLRAWYFSHLNLNEYDVIISVNFGAESKGIKFRSDALHICYCNAPTHYYWSRYDDYIKNPGFGLLNPVARLGLKLLVGPMRKWDYKAAQRPSVMIANSGHIAKEIKKYYGRESTVIHPPVDTKKFLVLSSKFSEATQNPELRTQNPKSSPRSGYVVAGRQTPYKRFDLAIAAATKLFLPLTVLGNGPDHSRLVKLAGPSVKFKKNVSDNDMVKAFQNAKGFIFAGLDDFGITPVEAMAAGTPVIAFKAGGALDYVVDGQTGTFFSEQTVQSLVDALEKFETLTFSEETVVNKAVQFNPENFKVNIRNFVNDELAKLQK